jgi:ABC-type bacteriocin/lantibiotic exporter with double-glycine peptidase domain
LTDSAKSVYSSLGKISKTDSYSGKGGRTAIEAARICDYYGIEPPVFPAELSAPEDFMQFTMIETGIMRRRIVMAGKWWKDGSMPLLVSKKDGGVYALIPSVSGGYVFYDDNGKVQKLTEKHAKEFSHIAYCFYKPFENRAITLKEFYRFLACAFSKADVVWLLAISLAAGLLGMVMPAINKFVFNTVVPSGTSEQLFGVCVLIVGTVIVSSLFSLARFA